VFLENLSVAYLVKTRDISGFPMNHGIGFWNLLIAISQKELSTWYFTLRELGIKLVGTCSFIGLCSA
jgi:hypothetical protein